MGKRRSCRVGLVLAGLMAGLAACTPAGPPPTTAPPATPVGTPAAPSPEPSPTSPSGPSPMPASDGGPMLWPTTLARSVHLDGAPTELLQYGFVDTAGVRVVPPRYQSYEYCRDVAGRATLVLAGSGAAETDILDLSGKVVGHVPGRYADCIGDTHAVFQTDISELGPLEFGSGLFDLRSGDVVIPVKKGRTVTMVDRRTVNVHRAKDEYFLDLITGERTPHPGFLTGYLEPTAGPEDLMLLPAGNVLIDTYVEPEEEPLIGYLDRTGGWALQPVLARAEPFRGGFAAVGNADAETMYFVDATFQQVGRDWSWVSSTEWGYVVGAAGDDQSDPGLLGLDLRVFLEPGVAESDCGWESSDACAVHPHSGPPQVLLLPEGTLADPPAGFSGVLSRTLFTDGGAETPARTIHNTDTGTTFALDRPSTCRLVGGWIACRPVAEAAPPTVHRSTGERTGFREVALIDGAVLGTASGYYWAVSGSTQGFIDDTGHWLYRESRYTTLED